MRKLKLNLLLLVLAVMLPQISQANEVNLELSPAVVEISAFYNGTTVVAKGRIPADTEAVVRLSGAGEELHLKKKGKVAGLIWMNTDDLTLDNAPNVFMIYTPAAITDLGSSPARKLGFDALKDRITVSPVGADNDFIISEFIKLKQEDKLYIVAPATVKYGPVDQGFKSVEVEMVVPPRMGQGDYTVELAVVGNGGLLGITQQQLTVRQVGFPAQLSKLAFERPILHGVMAVLIALGAGLFIGIVFKDKGGSH